MPAQEIKKLAVTDLKLWSENPRDPLGKEISDYEIIQRAISEKKKWNLQKLIIEMGDYYDFSELPTVVNMEGSWVVLDGNRRISVLKYLQNPELYQSLNGGLFFESEPLHLKNLKVIPCNVCDFETGLNNIERKHINDKSWGRLERDYFLFNFRKKGKSLFIQFEEQTKAISQNSKLNQRFVKEEILTKENLNAIGFSLNKSNKLVSNYPLDKQKEIINTIVKLITNKIVDTRNNRGDIITPLKEHLPHVELAPFTPKKKVYKLDIKEKKEIDPLHKPQVRKTKKTKSVDILFGEKLVLKQGKVNDLYSFLEETYQRSKNDSVALQVISMSLRLLLEVAAREYYQSKKSPLATKDMVYKDFLKIAKDDLKLSKSTENYFSLTTAWLNGNNTIEALLGKFAHGNIDVSKEDVINSSIVVGQIIKYYFSKNNPLL